MNIHRVLKGETLAGIARKYQTAISIIERDNGKDCLYEGSRLVIRTGLTVHVVAPFERLDTIAMRYGVSVEDVMRENSLVSPFVYAGQQLVIPGKVKK